MDRLTYVTEDGAVLFSPDGKDSVTITDISRMGDTEFLEIIADRLANREVSAIFYERKYNEVCKELKAYKDTGFTSQEIIDGKLLTRWIAVKNQPPKHKQEILCTDGCSIYKAEYDKGSFNDNGITHWMPLPELPKEDKP